MAKHEKATRFTWDVPEHDFAEAKVKRLESENQKLTSELEEAYKTIKALEKDLARMDRVYDNSKDRSSEIIANKDAEIELLRAKIVKLVAHYV